MNEKIRFRKTSILINIILTYKRLVQTKKKKIIFISNTKPINKRKQTVISYLVIPMTKAKRK